MSDEAKGAKGAIASWFKTTIASLFALVSGAVIMYASPLIDRVIKPAKPLANFEWQAEQLKVTFHNRSTGGLEGFWDFGDGSALEPYVPSQESVAHQYAKPGQYTAKLTIENLLNDKSDRTANVNLEPGGALIAEIKKPTIDYFEVTPISGDSFAPATFRLASKFKNADTVVWALGHEYPLEVVPAASTSPERYVTFKRDGTHVIKLAVSNGKEVAERTQVIQVKPSPKDVPVAMLTVTQEAIQVETKVIRPNIGLDFPSNSKDAVYKLTRHFPHEPNYEIVKAVALPIAPGVAAKDLKVEISKDQKSAKVTCDVLKPTAGVINRNTSLGSVQIELTMEKRTVTNQMQPPVLQTVNMQGPTILPLPTLPPGWTLKDRKVDLKLMTNNAVVWPNPAIPSKTPMPSNEQIMVGGRAYYVTGVTEGNQVRLNMLQTRGSPVNGN